MSGKGAHINVLGERIRRYYEHLMTDACSFVDEVRKDLEGPSVQASHTERTATPRDSRPMDSQPGTPQQPRKRAH